MNQPFTSQRDIAGLLAQSKDLHSRILFVLMALAVYRLGVFIPIPGVDAAALTAYQSQLQQGLFGFFNLFTGGAFSQLAIFALGILPYITASIMMQLGGAVFPILKELKKEGPAGQQKIGQWTKYLTMVLAFGQGFGLATGVEMQTVQVGSDVASLVLYPGMAFKLQTAFTIMTGTLFLMWLGDQITARGIGNGMSILIYAGIVAEMPGVIYQIAEMARTGTLNGFFVIALMLGLVGLLFFITWVETAQRRIPLQYPKSGNQMQAMQQANHLPLKVNMAGVIPAIFASALLMAPVTIASLNADSGWAQFVGAWLSPGQPMYMVLFAAMIIFFAYFFVAEVSFIPADKAKDLKESGASIPGIRPGEQTANYLDGVATRLTTIGAAYLAFVCVLPDFLHLNNAIPVYIGGTSLLIMVSVTLDMVQKIQSALIAARYEQMLQLAANASPKTMTGRAAKRAARRKPKA